jgi:excisionase family DNA binding protein
VTAPQLLTVAEVAQALRVSPKTVRALISCGQIKAIRVGHQLRIFADSVDDYRARAVVKVVHRSPRRSEAWSTNN